MSNNTVYIRDKDNGEYVEIGHMTAADQQVNEFGEESMTMSIRPTASFSELGAEDFSEMAFDRHAADQLPNNTMLIEANAAEDRELIIDEEKLWIVREGQLRALLDFEAKSWLDREKEAKDIDLDSCYPESQLSVGSWGPFVIARDELRVEKKPKMAPVFEDMNHDPDEDIEHDEKVYEAAFKVEGGLVVPTEEGKQQMQEKLDELNKTSFAPGGVLLPLSDEEWEKCRKDDSIPVLLSGEHFTSSYKSEDLAKEYPMSVRETLEMDIKEIDRDVVDLYFGRSPEKKAKEHHVQNSERKIGLIAYREGQWTAKYTFNGHGGFIGNNLYNAITKALRDRADYFEIRGSRIPVDGLQSFVITETGMPDITVTVERKS